MGQVLDTTTGRRLAPAAYVATLALVAVAVILRYSDTVSSEPD